MRADELLGRDAADAAAATPLLEVSQLCVDYWRDDAWQAAVRDVDLVVHDGEALGVVGESGSGKSTLVHRLLGYRSAGSRTRGSARIGDVDMLSAREPVLRRMRGRTVSFVPQNPLTSLAPHLRVGTQLAEALTVHGLATRFEARNRALELLGDVHLPDPRNTAQKYPHQLSGGQLQRVVIAMAMACRPKLLVMDEPTTGLDVTTQDQILRLVQELRTSHGTAVVYVSHDLAVVSEVCDTIAVMYAGRVIEKGRASTLFQTPRHPYTDLLIRSMPAIAGAREVPETSPPGAQRTLPSQGCAFAPRCAHAVPVCAANEPTLQPTGEDHAAACHRAGEVTQEPTVRGAAETPRRERVRPASAPLLAVRGVTCSYGASRGLLGRRPVRNAVVDVEFEIAAGETVGLIGESGSGKSTIAKAVIGLLAPRGGTVEFAGASLPGTCDRRDPDVRRRIQMVPQNPDASLNPQQRVGDILGRPVRRYAGLEGRQVAGRIAELLEAVHLEPAYAARYPRELSGGERQRVAIARALAAEPELLLCDEILSALDVSTQAGVRQLLRQLQQERGLAYLFISHDMAVVREIADRVVVMYHGRVCEVGPAKAVYRPLYHPYTHRLLSAVPGVRATTGLGRDAAAPVSISEPGVTCSYVASCPFAIRGTCDQVPPPVRQLDEEHYVYCHAPEDELAELREPEWGRTGGEPR